jgi:hypothetical protein
MSSLAVRWNMVAGVPLRDDDDDAFGGVSAR